MITIEDAYLPITLTAPGLTDEQFQEFCERYSDFFLEYSAEGDLTISPPTDPQTSAINAEISVQLGNWRRVHRPDGKVTGSSGGFKLANGARRSPDAAWVSRARLAAHGCPEFLIELRKPEDRIKQLREKMAEWIANDVELAWLIDPSTRSVTIYRPGREPETRTGDAAVAGEGPVDGFTLDLAAVWNA